MEAIEETMEELERNDRSKIRMLLMKASNAVIDGKRHSQSTITSPKVLFGDEWNPSLILAGHQVNQALVKRSQFYKHN
jgi:hypothetical protein